MLVFYFQHVSNRKVVAWTFEVLNFEILKQFTGYFLTIRNFYERI